MATFPFQGCPELQLKKHLGTVSPSASKYSTKSCQIDPFLLTCTPPVYWSLTFSSQKRSPFIADFRSQRNCTSKMHGAPNNREIFWEPVTQGSTFRPEPARSEMLGGKFGPPPPKICNSGRIKHAPNRGYHFGSPLPPFVLSGTCLFSVQETSPFP